MRIIYFLFFILMATSCTETPDKVLEVIKQAGTNENELFKVINHYKHSGEKQKLKAAYYLIANMEEKVGVYYSKNSYFLKLLPRIDSLHKLKASSDKIDKFVKNQLALNKYKEADSKKIVKDIQVITSDYLINNIDLAFQVWREKPWAKHLNFDEFCEWILPYRVNDEPLQNWRSYMINELSCLKDSLKDVYNAEEACLIVNQLIAKNFQFSLSLEFVPKLGGIDAWNNMQGLCAHRYQLIVMAMRSIGIPVAIDFTPQFPNKAGSHPWTVLLADSNQIKTFNGGEPDIALYYPAICPIGTTNIDYVSTVFRYKYAVNTNALGYKNNDENIPPLFRNKYITNVSQQYVGVEQSDIKFDLIDVPDTVENIYLYTFRSGLSMVPVAATKIRNNQAIFLNIGRRGIYLPVYLENNSIKLVSNPIDLPEDSDEAIPIIADETHKQSVKLYRKFTMKYIMNGFVRDMQGAKIQGANKRDFSDANTLFVIDTMICYFDEFTLNQTSPYRYYRYLSSDSGDVRLAELAFIGKSTTGTEFIVKGESFGFNSNKETDDDVIYENAFDGNIRTNFNAPKKSWIAQDAGSQILLKAFKILPRNNLNIVEPGDTYELVYFNNGWKSLGEEIATNYYVEFNNVPTNAILLLRNKTKGSEERVFEYKNGKQVWR